MAETSDSVSSPSAICSSLGLDNGARDKVSAVCNPCPEHDKCCMRTTSGVVQSKVLEVAGYLGWSSLREAQLACDQFPM